MSFEHLTDVPLEQAKKDYCSLMLERGFHMKTECIAVQDACDRITAHAVYARINAPHYASSAADGVALRAEDTLGASGTKPVALPSGRYAPVYAGDPIPQGYDAVIPAKEIIRNEDDGIVLLAAAAPWQHVRQVGEDICAGEMLLTGFADITPAAIGAMIAGGVVELDVIRRPVVGIVSAGDRVVPPCADPKPGDVLEFNSAVFSALLKKWGAEPKAYPIVPDRLEEIRHMLSIAVGKSDLVILSMGDSDGREDRSAAAISAVGEVLCRGLAILPGKQTVLGQKDGTPILSVPGCPVSGIVVIRELLCPLIDLWFCRKGDIPAAAAAVLTRSVVSDARYREYVRVRMGCVGGRLTAAPLPRASGVASSFMKADGILEAPQGSAGFRAGEAVRVWLLTPRKKLENTLVITGSHDPLLDELADLIHREDPRLYVRSTHAGSMGGITAIRRSEAHAAGIHLLDTDTGNYNLSFVRRYFPRGGVCLIRCVGRQQGILLKKGNPLGIKAFSDLSRRDVRYVNRQKGSGTRVLMDYLCRKYGVSAGEIRGYEREEMTHNAVAVRIKTDSADAGMGIYSAAKLYDLDFLPVHVEKYDLLVPESAWDTPMIRQLAATLKSDAFARRISRMGGYTLDRPGEVIEIFRE